MSDNKVTLDQLDNSAIEAMSSSVGDVSMLNTENKTIVGAISEIVGKKEIANAIGEPLAETDKFTEMSSEINGLLSTFKTNMMNAGVAVESGDKFKALIDKIKGLTEGEGNKGVQMTSGVLNISDVNDVKSFNYADNCVDSVGVVTSVNLRYSTIDVNELGFIPSIIITNVSLLAEYIHSAGYDQNIYYSTLYNDINSKYNTMISNTDEARTTTTASIIYTNTIKEGDLIYLPVMGDVSNLVGNFNIETSDCNYIAIGVGEEDTTLRDSLASILQNKGVDVTEEDDMASLITKVDSMSGGLNIITATELPAVGIENQLCVINENPINEFMITSDTSLLDSNKTILYTTPNIPTNYTYTSELLTYELGIYKAKSGNNASATYCWKGSSWELICNAYYGILTNGKDTGSGTFSDYSNKLYHDTSKGVYRIGADNAYTQFVSYNELIDFSIYTKVEVDASVYSNSATLLTIGKSSTMYPAQYNNYNVGTACNGGFTSQSFSSTTLTTMTFDITSISGTGYLTIFKPTGGDAIEIKNIRLYY